MTSTASQPRRLILAIVAGLIALLLGVWAANTLLAPPSLDREALSGSYLETGQRAPDVQLVSHNGESFTGEDLEDRWTLLVFGFTHCPDVCPGTLAQLASVRQQLQERDLPEQVQTVFVTVDPRRDTPARLAEYVPTFHPSFTGVTGSLAEIDELASSMGIAHARYDDDVESADEHYNVDHGSAILLLNPERRLQMVFTPPIGTSDLSADVAAVLDFYHARHPEG